MKKKSDKELYVLVKDSHLMPGVYKKVKMTAAQKTQASKARAKKRSVEIAADFIKETSFDYDAEAFARKFLSYEISKSDAKLISINSCGTPLRGRNTIATSKVGSCINYDMKIIDVTGRPDTTGPVKTSINHLVYGGGETGSTGGGINYYSIKAANIAIDFDIVKAFGEMLKTVATLNPYVIAEKLLSFAVKSYKSAIIKIPAEQVYIVYWLYKTKRYKIPCEESAVIAGVKKLMAEEGAEALSDSKIIRAITKLSEEKVVELEDGKVRLVEKVRVERLPY